MEPECNFWGVKISPGEEVEVAPEFKPDMITSIHLTQAALGAKAAPGPHVIFVKKGEDQFALGTLDKERCPHFSLDIHLATECIALSHTGKSNVYLTGYEAVSVAAEDEDDGGLPFLQGLTRGGEASDEERSSEEESEDEEAPRAVPIANGGQKGGKKAMIEEEAEEGSSDEDEEEFEEGGSDEEDSEEEEGSEEESEDEEEGESSEEEDESSEEEPSPPPKPAAGAKRPAQKQPAATPQPQKRGKAADGAKQQAAPATAPAKVAAGKGAAGGKGSGEADYAAALKAYLQSKGPTKLAVLGSAVKRPAEGKVPKLKHFLEQHKATFKYNPSEDTVTLAA